MTTLTDNALAKAWYREPWPWLLMSGPALVIVAGFYTLWLAVKSDDGLVADDYYKRGLAINQTLSRTQRAVDMALGARLDLANSDGRTRVTVTGMHALPPTLRLRLVHPTQAVADQVIELRETAPGAYEGAPPAATASGRVAMLEDVERTWRLAGELHAGANAAVLAPQ